MIVKKRVFAKALNLIGILLMITVILVMVPLTVPKVFGIRIYGVLTGSMTPVYSIDGVVYVMEKDPEEIQTGDAITFQMGTNTQNVMTHRVVEIKDGFFITKGDANNTVDPEPVAFERLIGKVVFFIPGFAKVAELVDSMTGKCVIVMLFAAAFILWIAADLLYPQDKAKRSKKETVTKKGKKGNLFQIAGGILIVGAVSYLLVTFWQYRADRKEFASLEEQVFSGNLTADVSMDESETTQEEKVLTQEDRKILQGIASLHEENPDVIGWIRFDNSEISYPLMQAKDNAYYLKRNYLGEKNNAGSIFLEASNSPDLEDSHSIIYGHNMKDLSMFGSLKEYKYKDYYKEHSYFTIYTLDHVYRYQIFAYYDISMYGDVYNNQFGPDDFFQSFIDTMVSRSYYDTGLRPQKTDKIVTLSTCSTEGNRFVVNAVRVH